MKDRFVFEDSILFPEIRDTKKLLFAAEQKTRLTAINVTNLTSTKIAVNAIQSRVLANPLQEYKFAFNVEIEPGKPKNILENLDILFRDADHLIMWTNTYTQYCSISVNIKVYNEPEANPQVLTNH